ncbi:MAG: OmpH family outer membrane protein [Terriglobales bacterium]
MPRFTLLPATLCLAAALPLAAPAAAQTKVPAAPALPASPTVTGPSKIAFIQIQEAIVETGEGKKLDAALEARFAPRRADINQQEQKLAAEQKKLNTGGNTLSPAAHDALSRQFTADQRDYQQAVQNAQSDYQNAQSGMLNTVGDKMMPIIKQYAAAHGYTAVLDTSLEWPQTPVLYVSPGTNITGDIVKLYDKAYPVSPVEAKHE